VWKNVDGVLTHAVEPLNDHPNYPLDKVKHVRSRASTFGQYIYLPPIRGIPQTYAIWSQLIHIGRVIPNWLIKIAGTRQLMNLSRMRKLFDSTVSIEQQARSENAEIIRNHRNNAAASESYSAEELETIAKETSMFTAMLTAKIKSIVLPSPVATARLGYTTDSMLGYASLVVRGDAEDVLASVWDMTKRSAKRSDEAEHTVDEIVNSHCKIVYLRKSAGRSRGREYLNKCLWKKMDEGCYVYVASPTMSASRTVANDNERRSSALATARRRSSLSQRDQPPKRENYRCAVKITKLGPGRCRVEYVLRYDAAGRMNWSSGKFLTSSLPWVIELRDTFQSLRSSELYDAEDGKSIAESLMVRSNAMHHTAVYRGRHESELDARIRGLFERYNGLKDISSKHPFFKTMLARALQNKLRPACKVSTKLVNISRKEGHGIGGSLALSLVSNLTGEAAVWEWISRYPCLQQLDREEIWFTPFMNTVARRLLGEVSWGLKARVAFGAFLSVMDMASDINVVTLYLASEEQQNHGRSLLGMLILCLMGHLVIVFFQHSNAPRRKLIKEILFAVVGLKPVVDAWRVSSGADLEEGEKMDHLTIHMATKALELFAESIPGKFSTARQQGSEPPTTHHPNC
jgi:hypothetical protein